MEVDACTDSLQCSDIGLDVLHFCNVEDNGETRPSGYCKKCSDITSDCTADVDNNTMSELSKQQCIDVCEG